MAEQQYGWMRRFAPVLGLTCSLSLVAYWIWQEGNQVVDVASQPRGMGPARHERRPVQPNRPYLFAATSWNYVREEPVEREPPTQESRRWSGIELAGND